MALYDCLQSSYLKFHVDLGLKGTLVPEFQIQADFS